MNEPLSQKEICNAIKKDLKLRRITHAVAAEKLGCKKQTFSNLMGGTRKISKEMSKKMADAFGYSVEFLIYGTGELYAPGHVSWTRKNNKLYFLGREDDPVLKQSAKLQAAAIIIRIMNNKVAIRCFDDYCMGNMEEYQELLDILKNDFYANLPLAGAPEKVRNALLDMRDFFTDMEIQSAKELARIEYECAKGKKIAVDEEVERFRKKLLMYQEMCERHPKDDLTHNEE